MQQAGHEVTPHFILIYQLTCFELFYHFPAVTDLDINVLAYNPSIKLKDKGVQRMSESSMKGLVCIFLTYLYMHCMYVLNCGPQDD